jgi:hypothetical protein
MKLPATLAVLAAAVLCAPAQELTRLKYNNPGLVVDLAVGLWAFPLPMDFDGDGDLDLVVSCPDKPSNGLYVFENTTGDTAKNKFPVFKAGRRIGKGLQFAQISYVEGAPRVLTPAAEYPDFRQSGFEKPRALPLPANVHPNKVRGNFWKYADYDGDSAVDLMVGADDWSEYGWDDAYDATGHWKNGPLRGFVYLIRNTGSTQQSAWAPPVKIMAGEQPVETYGWPSPCLADFDGDGDLDLICGEFRDGFTYFENIGTRQVPRYAAGRSVMSSDGARVHMDLEMITPTAIDWDRDGDVDLIVGDEDGRVALVENTGRLGADRTPLFLAPRYFQQEADDLKCGALATPVGVDWDGDGDIDIVSGNSAGYFEFFENLSGPKVATPRWAAPRRLEAGGQVFRVMAGENGSIQGPAEAKWGYTTGSMADWDGDGLPDIIYNSILGRVEWLRNIGTRTAPKLAAPQAVEVEWSTPQPALGWGWLRAKGNELITQWLTTPVVVDWNRNGLSDLIMLDHEGYLALFERARREGRLVLLPPRRAFRGDRLAPGDRPSKFVQTGDGQPLWMNKNAAGKSGRRKLGVVDWDGDGKLDFLINGDNAAFLRQTGAHDDQWFFKDLGLLSPTNLAAHDVSPTTVDWDGDGVPDFLCGAEDGHFYYLRNPRSP